MNELLEATAFKNLSKITSVIVLDGKKIEKIDTDKLSKSMNDNLAYMYKFVCRMLICSKKTSEYNKYDKIVIETYNNIPSVDQSKKINIDNIIRKPLYTIGKEFDTRTEYEQMIKILIEAQKLRTNISKITDNNVLISKYMQFNTLVCQWNQIFGSKSLMKKFGYGDKEEVQIKSELVIEEKQEKSIDKTDNSFINNPFDESEKKEILKKKMHCKSMKLLIQK